MENDSIFFICENRIQYIHTVSIYYTKFVTSILHRRAYSSQAQNDNQFDILSIKMPLLVLVTLKNNHVRREDTPFGQAVNIYG